MVRRSGFGGIFQWGILQIKYWTASSRSRQVELGADFRYHIVLKTCLLYQSLNGITENRLYVVNHLCLEVGLVGAIMFIFMFSAKENYCSENSFVLIITSILRACRGVFCLFLTSRTSADVSFECQLISLSFRRHNLRSLRTGHVSSYF